MKVTLVFLAALALAAGSPSSFDEFPELIVRGIEVTTGEFPWMISLQMCGTHMCEGSILNPYWVVTAAHCVISAANAYTVVAGEHDLDVNDGNEQRITVQKIIRHPNYIPSDLTNDIAVIRLSVPLTFNNYVQPDNMPGANFSPASDVVTIGWGVRPNGGYISNTLTKLTVPYYTSIDCKLSYGVNILTERPFIVTASGSKFSSFICM